MSITFSSAYTAAVSAPNAVVDWLLELSNDNADPDFDTMYLSSGDRTVSGTLYHGLVLDWGDIDESLDLKKCSSKISDITITVDNSWHNAGGTLGEELFDGTDNYLYQNVIIRGWSPGLTSADLATAIFYRGRLVDIKEADDGTALKLTIEPRYPWDYIKVPQDKTVEGIYFPLVYGEYTAETSTVVSPQYCDDAIVWPMPVNEVAGNLLYSIADHQVSPNARSHFYDKNLNVFIPFDTQNNMAQLYRDTGSYTRYAILTESDLKRGFKWNDVTENADNEYDDFTDITATGSSDYASKYYHNSTPYSSTVFDLKSDIKQPDGYPTLVEIDFNWKITVDTAVGFNVALQLYYVVGGDVFLVGERTSAGTSTGSYSKDISAYCINGVVPVMKVWGNWANGLPQDPADEIKGTTFVNTLSFTGTYEINEDEPEAVADKLIGLNHVYTGGHGLTLSYTDAPSGPAITGQEPHHIFRDLMKLYTGVNMSDANILAGWSATETARSGWNCRLWELEPILLSEVLQQLQFEGQFIWQQYGVNARIIPLLESYSSSDISLEGWEIDKLKIGHTPFRDIVSTTTYHYNRHPATDKMQQSEGPKVNANRANWGFETLENVEEIDLRYLTGEVDELATVRDNLFGEPRLTVECDVVNPAKSNIEIGDTLSFSAMPREPLGGTFTGTYWLVEKARRTPSSLKITAREVG